MKRFPLLMLVATVALLSCNERRGEDSVTPQPNITLQWSVPESPVIQTRVQSTAETTLNNLWLFVFNSSGILEQKNKARAVRNNTHTADITIKEGTGLGLYVCANMSALQEAKFDGLVTGVARVADLMAITSDLSQLTAPGLSMWGELLNQTITAATTRVVMPLTRSCSRVDVGAGGVADFTLIGIEKLLKAATTGPIFPGSTLVQATSTVDIVPTNKALGSIYLYENAIVAADEATAEIKATAIIVRATYKGFDGYYKLRIKYGTPAKYDIGRNVIYSLNITSVKAPGFATLAEAEASFPQNVDYTVTASDDTAMDLITSNGQYYMGVTNSEYVAYNSDAMNYEAVVTVTHNAPSSVTTGTVTASGAGLTLRNATIPTSTQKQEIRVDMANYFTSGTLTIRLGNLIKVVTLKKKPTLNMNNGLNSDYSAASYMQGDWDDNPVWLRFATNTSMNGFTTRRVQNPSGGIWLRFDHNMGQTNTPRSVKGYVTSTDSRGRSRIVLKQESGTLDYVSGAPSRIPSINPATFTINVKTDLPGWTIRAKDIYMQPFSITLGAKTGSPVRGTPTDCSISVTVPNNMATERTIYLCLSANEDPSVETIFTSLIQEKVPATISLSIGGAGGIPYYGGVATTTVISSHAWYVSGGSLAGVAVSPSSGGAGSTSVSISMPVNLSTMSRTANITFSTNSAGYTANAVFGCNQLASPAFAGSYIPRSVLEAAGWPTNRLSAIGLQIATRGERVFPGDTPAGVDPQWQWCAGNPTLTPNVEMSADAGRSQLGKGEFNTDMMIRDNACPAASYCRQMGPEWYLPSARELVLISQNVALLGSAYTFPQNNGYWTSTQFSEYESHVWTVGYGWRTQGKGQRWYVRCVRNI